MNTARTVELKLHGYQAIFQPSKFGYSIAGLITDPAVIYQINDDRDDLLNIIYDEFDDLSKVRLKPEPWETIETDVIRIKCTWTEQNLPIAFDCDLNQLIDPDITLIEGSDVIATIHQHFYIKSDGRTCGTTFTCSSFQIVKACTPLETVPEPIETERSYYKQTDGFVYQPIK